MTASSTATNATGNGRATTRQRAPVAFACLVVLCVAVIMAELALGQVHLPVGQALATLFGDGGALETAILWQIRVPRVMLGIATGAALGLSGAALQGLLRNPLAEPGLLGVSAGASLGAVAAIVLGGTLAAEMAPLLKSFLLPLAAFLGSILVIAILFGLAHLSGGPAIATLILAGVAINAIVAAGIGMLIYVSDDQQLRDLTFWTMGSLASASSLLVALVAGLTAVTLPLFLAQSRALDLLQLGERAAFHAGLAVDRSRLLIALATALSVGAVTSAAGPIGFIGLAAPHIARLIFGPLHRLLLPASALVGIVLILSADLAVRLAVPPAEPPIGLATSLIGGPFFLWLLMRQISKARLLA